MTSIKIKKEGKEFAFSSVREGAEFLGISPQKLVYALNKGGTKKLAGGFSCEYSEEKEYSFFALEKEQKDNLGNIYQIDIYPVSSRPEGLQKGAELWTGLTKGEKEKQKVSLVRLMKRTPISDIEQGFYEVKTTVKTWEIPCESRLIGGGSL